MFQQVLLWRLVLRISIGSEAGYFAVWDESTAVKTTGTEIVQTTGLRGTYFGYMFGSELKCTFFAANSRVQSRLRLGNRVQKDNLRF